MDAEYEANLFALALLEDQANLTMKMAEITPYLLQNIVEGSVEKGVKYWERLVGLRDETAWLRFVTFSIA